jgi:hypothetical protein
MDEFIQAMEKAPVFTLLGACLTEMDPKFEYISKFGRRNITIQKRGQMDCENIWGCVPSVGDTCYIVSKIREVKKGETINYAMLDNAHPVTFQHHGYISQFYSVVTPDNYIPADVIIDAQIRQIFPVGTCYGKPISRAVESSKEKKRVYEKHIISMKEAHVKPKVPMLFDLF